MDARGRGQRGEGASGHPGDNVWGEQRSSLLVSEQTLALPPPPCVGPSPDGAGGL